MGLKSWNSGADPGFFVGMAEPPPKKKKKIGGNLGNSSIPVGAGRGQRPPVHLDRPMSIDMV